MQKWNLQLIGKIFETHQNSVEWCQQHGLLPTTMKCRNKHEMILSLDHGKGRFRCQKSTCRGKPHAEKQLTDGTWFDGTKLTIKQVMTICYSFAMHDSYDRAILEAYDQDGTERNRHAIADWYSCCREVVVSDYLEREVERGPIGGPGKVVQLDESKFGKRKYNRGRHVEGYWILGMIEDGEEDFRLVLCPDNVRSEEALLPIIEQHVAKGSIIHTDCWKAYNNLDKHGYVHRVVNHSDPDWPFVAEDGTHTQRIESSWRPAKDHFRSDKPRHTCKKCRNILAVMCDKCRPMKKACPECSNSYYVCKDCLKTYKKCKPCKEIKQSCEK